MSRLTDWLMKRGILASVAESERFDRIDQEADHLRECRCELRGMDMGDSGFVGGCQPHKAKPASSECEPHMHGYVRRSSIER